MSTTETPGITRIFRAVRLGQRRMTMVRLIEEWGAQAVVGALVDAGVLWPNHYTGPRSLYVKPSTVTDFDAGFVIRPGVFDVWPGGGIVNRPIPEPTGCDTCRADERCPFAHPPVDRNDWERRHGCACDCHRHPEVVHDRGAADPEGSAA